MCFCKPARPLGGLALAAAMFVAALGLSLSVVNNAVADPPGGPMGGVGAPPLGGGMNQPPSISGLYIEQITEKRFRVAGYVADEDPANCGVVFSGAATGAALCDGDGYFDVNLDIPTLGNLTITPGDGVQAGQATTQELTNGAPMIFAFTATKNNGQWTFSGAVMDEACNGLPIVLSGPDGVNGLSTTVGANGLFSILVTLPANSSGFVTAGVVDWYGATDSSTTYFSD